ncbi:class I SAM-dependent methyltransferase [Bacillus inaquosorum]|uniref:class I SAM-dependent methyltransferase n=1 Tax=Bacillus inaquosorum TaxID=483913 RepID=UPI00227EA84F|nr:class I SAM-dependent methyltransferase [Bacillus inaquosorum]MCY8502098.1 class I SAM-dependent methyltransferase [Bacillus inaquosorum]MCY8996696.1 class I SAM-dependent methyltransferase [Bacillus inaquosorum]MCY9028019.1 class I SAM-dependent methyltransferase [Bacillus inaquosorum]MED0796454.1 class I SAM-dependent methyltransferase [Bacillus inaquosorum]
MEINKRSLSMQEYQLKDKAYYKGVNWKLFDLVGPHATNILEVGCAEGLFGAAVKEKVNCSYFGVESYPPAAEKAAHHIDEVITGDIETLKLPFEKNTFDHVIFGDVLEHLIDPWAVLANMNPYVKETGSILASIPNIGHISIFESLLTGKWTYTQAGLLDKTHYRFFTLEEMKKMFHETGYKVSQIDPISFTTHYYEKMISKLAHVNANMGIHHADFENEARAYQYVIKAQKR